MRTWNSIPQFGDIPVMGGPFDIAIVGAGPTGMLTALLAKAKGFAPLVVEARGAEATRQQLVRLAPDTIRSLYEVGAGERIWRMPLDPMRPESRIVPIRAVESALRGAADVQGVPVWYGTTLDAVHDLGGTSGITARAVPTSASIVSTHDDTITAKLLVDASGGRWKGTAGLGMELQDKGLAKVGIPLRWTDVTPKVQPRAEDLAVLATPTLADGSRASFVGITDAVAGTYGVLEVPASVPVDRHAALVDAVEAELGTAGHRASSNDTFEIRNALARKVRSGNVIVVGDGAGRTDPQNGRGLNSGAADARDAAMLLDHLQFGATQPATNYRWGREAIMERFAGQVQHRHADDLHSALAPSPFAR